MKKIGTILVSLLLSLALVTVNACTTINPYTEEKQTAKAT